MNNKQHTHSERKQHTHSAVLAIFGDGELGECFDRAARQLRVELGEDDLSDWKRLLKPYLDGQVVAAFDEYLREGEKFFPKPVEITNIIKRQAADNAPSALERLRAQYER